MLEILRNMLRRKTRIILTVSGIAIGIFAFTVMGSMAEKINLLVSGGTKYYQDKVIVADGTSGSFGIGPMSLEIGQELADVEGVLAVQAEITLLINDLDSVSFGIPPMIIGSDGKGDQYETFKINMAQGEMIGAGDSGKVMVGSDLVGKLGAKVGQKINLKDKEFEVVGIMEKTLTAPDQAVYMDLADAQLLFHATLPDVVRSQVKPESLATGFTVYPKEGVDPNGLAEKINKEVTGVKASGPKEFEDTISSATGILNSILFGIAAISLLVGGLSIINTMTMSISERTREIGIKKAVGARTRNIMGEYLTEAGLIGFFGGIIGWILGAVVIVVINSALAESGNLIFLLTTRITIFAIAFAVILGVLAGIYPAYHAVKINIVKALREE